MYSFFKFCKAFAYGLLFLPLPPCTFWKKEKWKFEISAVSNSILKLNCILLSGKNPSCSI